MDNAIRCDVDGFNILLPAESQLPGIKRDLPQYGTNVGRLARTVAEKYPGSTILDVGANVGDTVAAIRRYCAAPVLCVEGCEPYLKLLRENATLFREVEIEPSFVGTGETLAAAIVVERGTGFLTPTSGAETIATRSLDEILRAHPRFSQTKLLKIDTDGWDSAILQHHVPLLSKLLPVVFFEYDPHFFTGPLAGGGRVFEALRKAGYHDLLFWENTGDYLLSTTLEHREQLMDLHEAVRGRSKMRYWDIAAFARDDADLARRQRAEELAFFRAHRPAIARR